MLSIIAFIVGIVLLFKGSFRLGNRQVARPQARAIGFSLIAPLVIVFCVYMTMAPSYVQINDDNTFSFSVEAIDQMLGSLATLELITVMIAIGLSLFTIYGSPPVTGTDEQPYNPTSSPFSTPSVSSRVPDIMTVAEAAAYLRVSEAEVLQLIDAGKLGAARIGGTYRIAKIAVDDLLSRGGPQAQQE